MSDDKKAVAEEKKAMMDVMAMFMNVTTSVLIVFVNKVLLDPKHGYKFTFATTLCAFHFLSCAASIWVAQALKFTTSAKLPWGDAIYFAIVANTSIASLNLSLLVNTVGFYQIAKLLIIPFVCLVELFWLKRSFTTPVILSVCTVIAGVATVSVSDVQVNALGLIIAGVSVVTSGMQQILCGTMQKKHHISSHQLLANTAPLQGISLLVIGPFVDKWVSGAWIGGYQWHTVAIYYLVASCVVAVAVNISQFMCLGRFSAVTFQVLGHTKTVMVLLISWLVLHETMSARKVFGMALAVAGMVAYGYFTSRPAAAQQQRSAKVKAPELLPLLQKDRHSDGIDVTLKPGESLIGSDYRRSRAPSPLQ